MDLGDLCARSGHAWRPCEELVLTHQRSEGAAIMPPPLWVNETPLNLVMH